MAEQATRSAKTAKAGKAVSPAYQEDSGTGMCSWSALTAGTRAMGTPEYRSSTTRAQGREGGEFEARGEKPAHGVAVDIGPRSEGAMAAGEVVAEDELGVTGDGVAGNMYFLGDDELPRPQRPHDPATGLVAGADMYPASVMSSLLAIGK